MKTHPMCFIKLGWQSCVSFSLNEVAAMFIKVLPGKKKSQVLRAKGLKHHYKQMLTFGVLNNCVKIARSLLPLYSDVTSTVL